MSCVIIVIAEPFSRVRAPDKLYDCFYIDSLRTISKAENQNRHCWGNHLSGSSPSLLTVVHTRFWSLYCHCVMQGKRELYAHLGMHFAGRVLPLRTEVFFFTWGLLQLSLVVSAVYSTIFFHRWKLLFFFLR